MVSMNRKLSPCEYVLVRWMLENGEPAGRTFLPQLEKAQITPWRCACGCASIHFSIKGYSVPSGEIHPLGNFAFGTEADLSGIFVYEQSGVLSGLEVYGLGGDASKSLPTPESLSVFSTAIPGTKPHITG